MPAASSCFAGCMWAKEGLPSRFLTKPFPYVFLCPKIPLSPCRLQRPKRSIPALQKQNLLHPQRLFFMSRAADQPCFRSCWQRTNQILCCRKFLCWMSCSNWHVSPEKRRKQNRFLLQRCVYTAGKKTK